MRRLLLPLCVCLLAATAAARVISYAPYSDRLCMPAVQHRGARHFALVEFPNNGVYTYGQVVLYDTKGSEEPRVVYPVGGGYSTIFAAAVREDDQQLAILLQTDYAKFVLSVDGGNSWKSLANVYIYNALMSPYRDVTDAGGPYVRARHGRVRVGTRDVPFILDSGAGVVYAISANGTSSWIFSGRLVGTSRDGATLLVNSSYFLGTIDLISGKGRFLGYLPILGQSVEGWITPAGNAYVEIYNGDSDTGIYYFDGAETFLAGNTDYSPTTVFPNVPPIRRGGTYFAVPTADYSGAWLIARTNATTLSLHTAAKGLVKQWDDFTAPEVEALHPGSSGKTVLVQVHRPRVTLDQSLFKDPALAVWHVGDPAPKFYDELFLVETAAKGFVRVDADAVESGEPFVFDSGIERPTSSGGISAAPPGAGGSDVIQEWGVVHASLAQRLVLPGAARTPGAFGSFWATDVTFYNPSDASVNVAVRYAPNGGGVADDDGRAAPARGPPRQRRAARPLRRRERRRRALHHARRRDGDQRRQSDVLAVGQRLVRLRDERHRRLRRDRAALPGDVLGRGARAEFPHDPDADRRLRPRPRGRGDGVAAARRDARRQRRRADARAAAGQLPQRRAARAARHGRGAGRAADARRGHRQRLRHRQSHQRRHVLPARHLRLGRAHDPRHRPRRRRERHAVPQRSVHLQQQRVAEVRERAGDDVGRLADGDAGVPAHGARGARRPRRPLHALEAHRHRPHARLEQRRGERSVGARHVAHVHDGPERRDVRLSPAAAEQLPVRLRRRHAGDPRRLAAAPLPHERRPRRRDALRQLRREVARAHRHHRPRRRHDRLVRDRRPRRRRPADERPAARPRPPRCQYARADPHHGDPRNARRVRGGDRQRHERCGVLRDEFSFEAVTKKGAGRGSQGTGVVLVVARTTTCALPGPRRCAAIWKTSAGCTTPICRKDSAPSRFPTPLRARSRMRQRIGPGSGPSPPRRVTRKRKAALSGATTCTRPSCSAPCAWRRWSPALPSASPATPSGTPPPRTCSPRPRHPDYPGAPRPPRRRHDDDLHPRPQPRCPRRPQSLNPL